MWDLYDTVNLVIWNDKFFKLLDEWIKKKKKWIIIKKLTSLHTMYNYLFLLYQDEGFILVIIYLQDPLIVPGKLIDRLSTML